MAIFRSQNDLIIHKLRLHREEKGTQTEPQDAPVPTAPVTPGNADPPPSSPAYVFTELSLKPGDTEAQFF